MPSRDKLLEEAEAKIRMLKRANDVCALIIRSLVPEDKIDVIYEKADAAWDAWQKEQQLEKARV